MSARRAVKGASAPSNVVRLPTAAARKVKQQWGRGDAFSRNRDSLPQFPGQNLAPYQRQALDRARLICSMERTPELCIATAIFNVLDDMQKTRVLASVALMALKDGDVALKAMAWLEMFVGGVAEHTNYAIRKLNSGEWD